MANFNVGGSHGELEVSVSSGYVLGCDLIAEQDGEYMDIVRFDIWEYAKEYPNETLGGSHVDILDIGYWMIDGTYEPPREDWRNDYRLALAAGELSPYPCGLLR